MKMAQRPCERALPIPALKSAAVWPAVTWKTGRLYQSDTPEAGTRPLTTPRPSKTRGAAKALHPESPKGEANPYTAFTPRWDVICTTTVDYAGC